MTDQVHRGDEEIMRQVGEARALDLIVHPALEGIARVDAALEEQPLDREVLEGGEIGLQELGVDPVHGPARGDQGPHDAARRGARDRPKVTPMSRKAASGPT